MPRSTRKSAKPFPWTRLPDGELLDLRLCELGVSLEGTPLERRIERLDAELAKRKLHFRPHCWLSSDWFSPAGVTGFAIPFYLAHPRLRRLEQRQMLQVEGGDPEECMQLMRHEAGHAIDTAFRLHRRASWRAVFGPYTLPYPDFYQARPYSKDFVLHLDAWYSQSHPAEDFAETFAVWLDPRSQWQREYKGWPALEKLRYVTSLMEELAGSRQPVLCRERTEELSSLRTTLREYYAKKRQRYSVDRPDFYDSDLQRLFAYAHGRTRRETAARFLLRLRPELRELVASWTGVPRYTIDQVLKDMIGRCRELELVVDRPEKKSRLEATILLTVQTMNYLHSGFHRRAR
jgi:putative zinc-binding metallo-peptidase